MFDLLQDSVWQKASGLVKSRYGKSLSYRAIKLISEGKSVEADAIENYYSHGDDLIIPLTFKSQFLGDVVVSRGSMLEDQEKIEVVELVKFLVEPKLYNISLKKAETSLEKGLTLVREEDHQEVVSLYGNDEPKPQLLSQVFLLKSASAMARHRVAHKLHEMSERFLFVTLNDMLKSIQTAADLSSLSDTTIFIEDIEQLDFKTIELINQAIETTASEGPLFLIGSKLSSE